jgi:hypothetical protein
MKALIATAAGVLVLGGVIVATSGRTTSAQAAPQSVQAASLPADRPTLVNCGEGRHAVVYPNRGNGFSQVECVAQDPYARPFPTIDNGVPMAMGYAPQPVSQYTTAAPMRSPTVVQERVVYRDRPVTSSRSTVRRSQASTSRTSYEPARRTRSWKKSAVIIGGSTAGGAGVGALLGGKGGAKKGAVAGLVGGTIYDIATRNKH